VDTNEPMVFQVVESRYTPPEQVPCILLERTTWDDYDYKTLFRAYLVQERGRFEPLGRVKILQKGELSAAFPGNVFRQLEKEFCSLGQDEEYYERLNALGTERARGVLNALCDLALTPSIEEEFVGERGITESLLRFPNAERARAEARKLFGGGVVAPAPAGELAFTFSTRLRGFEGDHVVPFRFPAGKDRLGRIVAIGGRNGTGKTQLIARLARGLSGLGAGDPDLGRIEPERRARVVVVSFNAFDHFTTPINNMPGGDYSYYGLRPPPRRTPEGTVRSDVNVAYALERLRASIDQIWRLGPGYQRDWTALLGETGVLKSEPGLGDPFATEMTNPVEMGKRIKEFTVRLRSASAGHQLLVFVATALVESVRAGSVVFLDEPETHLHAKLLSTLIRLLYEMLAEREAYAVIATHSPVVLQELPGRCIQILRLVEGRLPLVKPYPRESFGETLDEIIHEAFGVAEEDRSYVTILRQLVEAGRSRTEIEELFEGLGFKARLLLRELSERRGDR
jgi:ABC-type transport system involved in cytochrome c biogenesis ATPase subunit